MANPSECIGISLTNSDGYVATVHSADKLRGMLWTYRGQTMLSDIPADNIAVWLTARMAEIDNISDAEVLVGTDLLTEEV